MPSEAPLIKPMPLEASGRALRVRVFDDFGRYAFPRPQRRTTM
jgi:hypothetical protein